MTDSKKRRGWFQFPTIDDSGTVRVRSVTVAHGTMHSSMCSVIRTPGGPVFYLMREFVTDGDSAMSAMSAINTCAKLYKEGDEITISTDARGMHGASFGAALVLALRGTVGSPRLAATGYFQDIGATCGYDVMKLELQPVNGVTQKLIGCADMVITLIFSSLCKLGSEVSLDGSVAKTRAGRSAGVACRTMRDVIDAAGGESADGAYGDTWMDAPFYTWMDRVAALKPTMKDLPLISWRVVGSHDSGTATIVSTSQLSSDAPERLAQAVEIGVPLAAKLTSEFARTQSGTILEQLASGVRYIDLRIELGESLRSSFCVHAMKGQSLESVVSDLSTWLSCQTSEPVIVHIQSCANGERALQMMTEDKRLNRTYRYRGGVKLPTYAEMNGGLLFFLPADASFIRNPFADSESGARVQQFLDESIDELCLPGLSVIQSVVTPSVETLTKACLALASKPAMTYGIWGLFNFDDYAAPTSLRALTENQEVSMVDVGLAVARKVKRKKEGCVIMLDFVNDAIDAAELSLELNR